ncbi:MAG: response regulator, partial [Phormidesmis sp.]
QADGSANRHYEGTGLGLALVQELCELHGGQVSVQSVYGEGTTFTVDLPLGSGHLPDSQVVEQVLSSAKGRAAVELSDIEQPSATVDHDLSLPPEVVGNQAERDLKGSQVLVVDDNPDLRAYVSSVLQREGYQVIVAEQGAAGLAMATKHSPDLIITDLMMPGVNGLEMIERIRRDINLQGIPIVLLTAKADEGTRLAGVEQGADAYLSKPFNDRELLAEVRNLLALKSNERKVAQLNQYLTESVLQRFLPPPLVKKASEGDLQLDLRPEPRLVTILFSDIVGFTQLSNTLRSRRVAELLNEYLAAMTHAIFENGGTVDKFMGDAVLALFGAPEELSPNEQVRRAIAAARQMYRNLDNLNQQWAQQGIGPVQFRCGIHQGTAVVGMFGGAERSDYTAIGPSVNIAARIQESATAETILVSAAVADYLDEREIVKFEPLQLKGVDETVLTFGVKPCL